MKRWVTIRTTNVAYARRRRVWGVFAVLFLIYVFIFASLLFKAKTRKVFAYSGSTDKVETLKAMRGTIYDKNLNVIAGNYYTARISIKKEMLEKIGYSNFKLIAKVLKINTSERYYKQLLKSRKKVILLKEIPYHEFFDKEYLKKFRSKELLESGLGDVVIFDYRYKRYYSTDRFYSKFLAYMYEGEKGTVKIGIERFFDSILSGKDGERIYPFDKRLGFFKEQRPVDGKSIVLTIDSSVQFISEKIARKSLKKYKADNIFVVVSKPKTGEILGIVSVSRKYGNFNSLVVSGAYEPGSTMKPIVGSIALDAGVVREDSVFNCEHGRFKIKKRIIRDHKGYDRLTFPEIIWHSSNIGITKVALKLKPKTFYYGLKLFGFGKKTGIPFNGESAGIFPSFEKFNIDRQISMSFGYGLSVNAVQMVAALNAVVNGGVYKQPIMVKGVLENDGKLVKASLNGTAVKQETRKVISPITSAVMRQILKGVVEQGTGKNAQIEGLSIGGKTGTTKKLNGRRYGHSYIASFYGFFPAEDPAISIYVVVDNPRVDKYYGGEVAAPIFKEIVSKVYPFLIEEISKRVIDLPDEPKPLFAEKRTIEGNDPLGIKGLSFRQAVQRLSSNGIDFVCKGHGFVKGYRKVSDNFYQIYGSEL